MIVLTVLSYSGVPAEGLSARFDELGGSIGRADNNQLVLPDPERSISRLHARVIFRSGQYAIVDNGSNPIGVNGTPVPPGREQLIRPGDEVQIGSYLLKVSDAPAAGGSANPFADLFGEGAQGMAGPVAPPSATAWASPPMVVATPGGANASGGGMPPLRSAAPSPWDTPAAAWPTPTTATPVQAPAASGAGLLADDWDFLAPPTKAAGGGASPFGGSSDDLGGFGAPPSAGSALGLSMGPGAVDSLDSLFGLGNAPSGGDPLGAAPAQALLLQPNMAGHADPLRALGQQAADIGASRSDHGSELNTPMPLRRSVPPPAMSAPQPASPPALAPAGLPAGAIFSWDDPPRDGRVVTLPGMVRPSATPPAGGLVANPNWPAAPAVAGSGNLGGAGALRAAAPASASLMASAPSSPALPDPLADPLADPMFGALFQSPVNPASTAPPQALIDPLADLLSGDLLAPPASPSFSTGVPSGAPVVGGAATEAWPSDPSPAVAIAPLPAPSLPPQPVQAYAPLPAASAPSLQPPPSASADTTALLAALKQGLGVPGLRLDALTPETMLLVGQLLRESTRGAVELLVARAALKREMRAEMTMIVARENNPLKFSPSVEVALQHLLSPTSPGFMPAAPAIRDAFDDLRAHQLGVMAGMKAALEGVLQRFDPQQLEAKLTTRSAINSLIPATRKARLWESFQQLFSQLSSEAQDDFDELFGKAFLRAYEAQLDRMQAEPGPR